MSTQWTDAGNLGEFEYAAITHVNRIEELEGQIAAMTVDRDLWRDAHDEDCPNAAMVTELELQVKRLTEALQEYAIHGELCSTTLRNGTCDCGLSAALADVPDPQKEKP